MRAITAAAPVSVAVAACGALVMYCVHVFESSHISVRVCTAPDHGVSFVGTQGEMRRLNAYMNKHTWTCDELTMTRAELFALRAALKDGRLTIGAVARAHKQTEK